MNIDVIPSLGMLFPRPIKIPLQGLTVKAWELKLRHEARIEQAAAIALGHPFSGLERHLDAVDALPAGHADRMEHLDALWEASDQWPPRFGSASYNRGVNTVGVAALYLRLVLRATRPKFTLAESMNLAEIMTGDEWILVDRIAHGAAPNWHGPGSNAGIDWRSIVGYLTDPTGQKRPGLGMTMREVGELYMSQLFFLVRGDARYSVTLTDRPVVV